MGKIHLIHDHAFAAAQHHTDMVWPALTDEQRRQFFERSYLICKAMLESYCQQSALEAKRLHPVPSKN